MARLPRTRTRATPYSGGSVVTYDNGAIIATGTEPARNYPSSCSDYSGSPIVDSPFTSNQYTGKYPAASGTVSMVNPRYLSVYANYGSAGLPLVFATSLAVMTAPSGWMLDLVAGTNPSRPILNIPEAVENLASLPKMLKKLGDLILSPGNLAKPKGLAGEYLGLQFGWLPLIEDLSKLLDFQRYALKRNRELAQLYSGKGLRRRLSFGDDTANTPGTLTLSPYQFGSVTLATSVNVKRKMWGTIHWYPTTLPPYHPDDVQWNSLVTRLILGATPEAMLNGLWKVIPWTWLLGWFTNIGKYTLANSWTVPATHGTGCLMRSAEAVYTIDGVKSSNAAVKEVKLTFSGPAEHKLHTRIVATSVDAGFNMPYLDMFRLSILGSLFVQKFLGKGKPAI